jgi:PadR family transcriptional regulator, regulatory protein PadR
MKGREELKGHLDLLLLASLEGVKLHGYALIEELKRQSGGTFELPEGTVYPALHRLERAGLLSSRWSKETGRRRRVYQLTRKGQEALAERRLAWREFSTGIDLVLGEA